MKTPKEINQQAKDLANHELAKFHERCGEFERLVQLPAYSYAKQLGMDICTEYKCAPPKTEAERQNWETYNTLLWAFQRLFAECDSLAKQSPKRA